MTANGALRESECRLSMTPPAEGADLCSCFPPWDTRFTESAFVLIHGIKNGFVFENSLSNGVQELFATTISSERV
jgi:hypothetical protein